MKTNSTFFSLSCIFLVLVATVIGCKNDVKQDHINDEISFGTTSMDQEPTKLLVSQPFTNIRQKPEVLTLPDVSSAKSYTLKSGTRIEVPANAFEYLDGRPVTGSVDIVFTEIHSAAEIIASGIPMKFIDDNGKVQQMQSAGMFELSGEQNQQPIQLVEGKAIDIALVSDVEGAYDFWSFDEEKGNWNNEGAIPAKEGPTQDMTSPARKRTIERLRKQTKKKPVKPQFSEANKLVFNDLDLSQCPELKSQDPVVLVYIGTDKSKSPQENKWIRKPGIWHKKMIKPMAGKEGVYELTLLGDKMYQIEVKAAPTALEIDKANAEYQKELANFRAGVEQLKNEEALIENRKTFVRLASVRGFGRYNYDIMWKRKNTVELNADFEIEDTPDMVKDKTMIYLITDNGRTVVSLPRRNWDKFRFDPAADNKLLAVMPDNSAALFTESDFEEQEEDLLQANGNDFVFSLDKKDDKIESLADLDELLSEDVEEGIDPIRDLKLYPNPASDQVTISFESESSMEIPIQIIDANGRVVANQTSLSDPGKNKINFDLSNLANGNYTVRMITKTFADAKQLVIVKN